MEFITVVPSNGDNVVREEGQETSRCVPLRGEPPSYYEALPSPSTADGAANSSRCEYNQPFRRILQVLRGSRRTAGRAVPSRRPVTGSPVVRDADSIIMHNTCFSTSIAAADAQSTNSYDSGPSSFSQGQFQQPPPPRPVTPFVSDSYSFLESSSSIASSISPTSTHPISTATSITFAESPPEETLPDYTFISRLPSYEEVAHEKYIEWVLWRGRMDQALRRKDVQEVAYLTRIGLEENSYAQMERGSIRPRGLSSRILGGWNMGSW